MPRPIAVRDLIALAGIRGAHAANQNRAFCIRCGHGWPCPAVYLACDNVAPTGHTIPVAELAPTRSRRAVADRILADVMADDHLALTVDGNRIAAQSTNT